MGTMYSQAPVISFYEVTDLELVSTNSGEHGGVVAMLDRTVTKAGKDALKHLLTHPTADAQVIKARQALIQQLRDPAFRALIEEKLATIAKHEARLRRCFEKGFEEQTATALNENYFSSSVLKKYNNSATALDLNNAGQFFLIFTPLLEFGLYHGPFARWLEIACSHPHHNAAPIITDATSITPAVTTSPVVASKKTKKINHVSARKQGSSEHSDHHHDHSKCGRSCSSKKEVSNVQATEFSWKNALKNVLIWGHGAFAFAAFLKLAKDYYHRIEMVNAVHQSMISVNACINASVEISNALATGSIAASLLDTDVLMNIGAIEPDLVQQSADKCFAVDQHNHLSIFSRVGKTLASYTTVRKDQKTIEQLLSAVGSIDAMLSIAKVMDEPGTVYNFVTLRDGSEAYISLENFVHPQLTLVAAVKNSIILGDANNPKKLIITGPNKSGKSSVTKAIAVNVVLAQTFGIVAASAGTITPMHRLITYINIHDDLSEDASKMVAELKRTDKAVQELNALEGKAPSLCLFDDSLFCSTQSKEGEKLAYRFVKRLTTFSSSIIFVVTHYELLTNLATEMAGTVVNYRIGLINNADGNVASTYQLEPGISPRDAIFSIVKQGHEHGDLLG